MKKVFKTALDQACGKNKIVDQFHYIYFKNGFIYVSNGVVHLKQLMQLHGITRRTAEILDGFCMHKEMFKILNKHSEVILKVEHAGVMTAKFKDSLGVTAVIDIFGQEMKLRLSKFKSVHGSGLIVDQIDNMTKDFQMEAKKEIAIDPATIETLRKVFVTESSGFTLRFNKGKTGVLITPNQSDYKEHAIVKTLKLTGEINK